MRVRPAGRIIPARLATGKKNPIVRWGDFFARPPYFLAGAAVMAVANSSVMLK